MVTNERKITLITEAMDEPERRKRKKSFLILRFLLSCAVLSLPETEPNSRNRKNKKKAESQT
jgi:hypothetical protein